MTLYDDGWYFSKYVSGNEHLFTFKQEQSQYKKCNFNTCDVYAEVPKVKCLWLLDYKCELIEIMITYLWNAYVEILQISYYSDCTILSYRESTRFIGTTLV